ncbi:hypothetical protein NEFER03_1887 [Nematocida sp. LUAm3]|nr:hypothetical protein NEFER03_1887 [Nematocida sp. LUAm3]KAI5173962.1 hypothetical protein NEFER02_0429 [Nematocida sp. LUAm2]KAI5177293.1 hypothetical protein NEFER01_0568 [Nematocida sp. LUAm1]
MEHKKGRADGRYLLEERGIEITEEEECIFVRKYHEIEDKKIYSSSAVIYFCTEIKKPSGEKGIQGGFSIFSNDRVLQTGLERIFRESKIFPLDKLSILPKKAAWHIRMDVFVVSDQGGLLDLCVPAINRSLSLLSFPMHTLVFPTFSFCTKPLSVAPRFDIRTLTLGFYEDALYMDPSVSETQKMDGLLASTVTSDGRIINSNFTGAIEKHKYLDGLHRSIDQIKMGK